MWSNEFLTPEQNPDKQAKTKYELVVDKDETPMIKKKKLKTTGK